ncbi:response regulator transcription factor [Xylophilus sp. ASV27]|uniref:response regulator transcription factor n=1 Tax=Xylophilus sp. ASV27 TaxID=2795129 RepID=UPI0018EB5F62|nr:response regulator [Xylophilus sp. ASV27]
MSNSEVQSPHILIVDDDPDQLRLLVAALRGASYRVSVALNGDHGYARATVLQPDLILLDVRMPGRSGIAIAGLLTTNPATQHIPILFLSALTDEHDRLAGLRAGAVDYISKPFFVDEILERTRIHLTLSQRRARPVVRDDGIDQVGGGLAASNPLPASLLIKQAATEFILNHIHEPSLKSSDVASRMGVSMRRLNAVFETCDRVSVFEFMRQERMRRAALMLGQSTLSVADVAMEVGYSNSANFATEFRKFWGKSPVQLRSESQENVDALQKIISTRFAQPCT